MGRSNSSKKLYKSHRFLHIIGFTEIEIRGFQVLQVSSPHHHQLGRAWVEPRGFVVSEVSWIVRWEETSEVRGDVGLVFFHWIWGRSDLALKPSAKMKKFLSDWFMDKQFFHELSHFSSQLQSFTNAARPAVDLIAQKSAQHQKGCAGPPYCRNNCWPP